MTQASPTPQERLRQDELALSLGAWSLVVRGDEVAEICWDGTRLLRAIRPVVRDADWNTIAVAVEELTLTGSPTAIRLQVGLRWLDRDTFLGGVDFTGTLTLDLRETGQLTVDFAGESRSTFDRNRIGLVILHPLEEAGRPVRVVHSDDTVEDGQWPERISPHQPFRDVAGFHWQRDGLDLELALTGDIFETEDQRNWTDASFKTYSTPLDLPFPVVVEPGDMVAQSARLTVRPASPSPGRPGTSGTAPRPGQVEPVLIGDLDGATLPGLGVGVRPDTDPAALRLLGNDLDSLLLEVFPDTDLAAVLTRVGEHPLDVRLITDEPDEVARRIRELTHARVLRIGVFGAGHITNPAAWHALDEALPDHRTRRIAGTRAHFAELNRRFTDLPADAAALTFSLTPQMHASERGHLLDSLQTQRLVAREAIRLAAGRDLHVGPITLRRRFNAVATSDAAPIEGPDPLQHSDFTAAWTLASIAALTLDGVRTLHYYQADGPGGLVIDAEQGLAPVGRLIAGLAPLAGAATRVVLTPHGVSGLAVHTDDGMVVWLANLTGGTRLLDVGGHRVALPAWSLREVHPAQTDQPDPTFGGTQ